MQADVTKFILRTFFTVRKNFPQVPWIICESLFKKFQIHLGFIEWDSKNATTSHLRDTRDFINLYRMGPVNKEAYAFFKLLIHFFVYEYASKINKISYHNICSFFIL